MVYCIFGNHNNQFVGQNNKTLYFKPSHNDWAVPYEELSNQLKTIMNKIDEVVEKMSTRDISSITNKLNWERKQRKRFERPLQQCHQSKVLFLVQQIVVNKIYFNHLLKEEQKLKEPREGLVDFHSEAFFRKEQTFFLNFTRELTGKSIDKKRNSSVDHSLKSKITFFSLIDQGCSLSPPQIPISNNKIIKIMQNKECHRLKKRLKKIKYTIGRSVKQAQGLGFNDLFIRSQLAFLRRLDEKINRYYNLREDQLEKKIDNRKAYLKKIKQEIAKELEARDSDFFWHLRPML